MKNPGRSVRWQPGLCSQGWDSGQKKLRRTVRYQLRGGA